MQPALGTEAIVMVAKAGKGHNPWGRYWRVAVVLVATGYRPKRITARNRLVVRILHDSPRNFKGCSDRTCQFTREFKRAERLANEYNENVTRLANNALLRAAPRPLT